MKHKNCKIEINKHLDKWVGNYIVSTSLIVTFRAHNYFITLKTICRLDFFCLQRFLNMPHDCQKLTGTSKLNSYS